MVRVVQLVLLVRVVKQWLTSCADGELHMISETSGVLHLVRVVRLVLLVRVVKQWVTSFADGELHIISVT